jgi:hypothetical protein
MYMHKITGFIRGILRGVRYAKSLRVLILHRRSPYWTTLVLYSRVVSVFNEPTTCVRISRHSPLRVHNKYISSILPPPISKALVIQLIQYYEVALLDGF